MATLRVQSRFHVFLLEQECPLLLGSEGGTNSAIWHCMSSRTKEAVDERSESGRLGRSEVGAEDLSRQSSVSLRSIRRAELAECRTTMTRRIIQLFGGHLSSPVIEFIDENGGGPGVRLRKRQRVKQPK